VAYSDLLIPNHTNVGLDVPCCKLKVDRKVRSSKNKRLILQQALVLENHTTNAQLEKLPAGDMQEHEMTGRLDNENNVSQCGMESVSSLLPLRHSFR
jgi:hypothetical protein